MNINNPCCVPQLFKSFKNIQQRPRKILDKETVDEIIFNSANTRDRLILELQARCGLRVGEVLNPKFADVSGRKLMLHEPKSRREVEVAFMPEHIAVRLFEFFKRLVIIPMEQTNRLFQTHLNGLMYQSVQFLEQNTIISARLEILPES
jgi:integrase/recombinase XerD